MRKLILSLVMMFTLTGCYNYRELNDLAIVSGISIAKVDDGYELTVEVVNTKKEQDASSSRETDFVIYRNTSDSLQEGFRRLINEAPKKMYGAQIELLILDESLAKSDLKNIMDFLSRDPEVRSEFYVIVGKSDNILEITTPLVNINSKNIIQSLESNNTYLGSVNLVTFHDLIDNYLNDKIDLALPAIKMVGDIENGEENDNLEDTNTKTFNLLSNMAIFKDNKLVGYLTEEESKVYNLVANNIRTTLVKTDFDNGEYVINEMVGIECKSEVDPKKNSVSITVEGLAAISEANYSGDLGSTKEIKKIEKKLNKYTEDIAKKLIKETIKKYDSDIYGFEDMFYKKDAKYYEEHIKDNWELLFHDLDIEVKSNIEIFEKGNLNGGLYNE